MDLAEEQKWVERRGDLEVYVGAFAGIVVFNVLFHVIPSILAFVGASNPDRRTLILGLAALAVGLGISVVRPPRAVIAWLLTLAGPVLLGVWFSLKKTSEAGPVTMLMGLALLPLGVLALGGLRRVSWWKLLLVVVVGFGLGEVPAHWLRDRVGVEAAWLIGAGMISAASLAQSPTGAGRWRWVLGFAAAGAAAILAGVQIHIGSMNLEYHLPARESLLAPLGG